MEERLRFILSSVTELQRFAEAKHAVLLALQGSALVALIEADSIEQPHVVSTMLVVLLLGVIVSLLSFFPRTQNSWDSKLGIPPKKPDPSDNLLFFSHIVKYSPDDYLKASIRQYSDGSGTVGQFERDLANQIIVNAEITCRKYFLFKVSLTLSVLTLVIPSIIYFSTALVPLMSPVDFPAGADVVCCSLIYRATTLSGRRPKDDQCCDTQA